MGNLINALEELYPQTTTFTVVKCKPYGSEEGNFSVHLSASAPKEHDTFGTVTPKSMNKLYIRTTKPVAELSNVTLDPTEWDYIVESFQPPVDEETGAIKPPVDIKWLQLK